MLDDGERVVLDVRPHWSMLTAPLLLSAVAVAGAITLVAFFPSQPIALDWVLAAVVAACLAWLGVRLARWLATSLVVTTSRVVLRRGLLVRDLVQIRLVRIAEVHVRQSIVQRALGTGRVVIEIAGDEAIAIDDVRQPRAFQRVLNHELDVASGAYAEATDDEEWVPRMAPQAMATPPHGLPSTLPGATATGSGIAEQLIALDDLRRRGIVTASEFETKKAELLSRL